jgi:predicted nucleic acid-binding protein
VLADAKHPAHSQAVAERRLRSAPGRQITTDYVLDETITRLFSQAPFLLAREYTKAIFETEAVGLLRIERITPERFEAAYRLRVRYQDKPNISFTDLTSFVVMQELGLRDVLTADAHFTQVRLGFRQRP